MKERGRLREELGKRDGAGRGEGGRGQEEPLEGRVEGECRAEGLDLERCLDKYKESGRKK